MQCPGCGRPTKNPTQRFCLGCGKALPALPPPEFFQNVSENAGPSEIERPLSNTNEGVGAQRNYPVPPVIPENYGGRSFDSSDLDRLIHSNPWKCRQRIFTIRDRYDVKNMQDQVLFTVVGKIISLRRKLAFYLPENPNKVWLRLELVLKSVKDFIIPRYLLDTPNGEPIAYFRLNFLLSLIYSKWHIYDAEGNEIGHAKEESLWVAIASRYLSNFLKGLSTFEIVLYEQKIATYNRNFTIADSYTLNIHKPNLTDQEVYLFTALVALLDKGQGR